MECFEQEKQVEYIELEYGNKKVTVYLDWSIKDRLNIHVYDPEIDDSDMTIFEKEIKIK
jgi:hypothetical protein